jgi:hypothetical protein
MPGDAIAKVDGPRERGGCAVGVIGETSEETAYAAHRNAEAKWNGEEISGAGVDAAEMLGELHGDPSAKQTANDCLAARLQKELPVDANAWSLFEDSEHAAAKESSNGGSSDNDPPLFVAEEVSALLATAGVELVSNGVTYSLKDGMEDGMGDEVQTGSECNLSRAVAWDICCGGG